MRSGIQRWAHQDPGVAGPSPIHQVERTAALLDDLLKP